MVLRPNQEGMDKQFLAAPVKSVVDKYQLVPEFLKVRGYTNVRVGEPCVVVDSVMEQLNPHRCRLSDVTYAAPVYVDVKYVMISNGCKNVVTKNDVVIGKLPVMLRSCCCVLHGKDEDELARLGECPLDPGGYFIVKGTEKVILIQEQLSKNRIIIDTDGKWCLQASVMSSTEARKSKTVIVMSKEKKIYLDMNQYDNKVPVMVVMKAMGMESDQEVVQMLGRDPQYGALLMPSIEECASLCVYTQQEALEFLEGKVKFRFYSSADEKESRATVILRDVFIANIPVRENNF
ncbi:DNA-directed RNA polymerase [Heracleum sosnowskyi]|uniref:DNA-directed RNA polymerase n=1 Tax=Heracleum sosnowskyi TaxID=360622 RepID=A0AAD8HTL3_9APIA|nr:DNA-directed RNA polymerase [Heracleum sosnowskyi]